MVVGPIRQLRVWFDILTPKQVMLFNHAVSRLHKDGHDVLCTSRDYREVNDLAEMKGFSLEPYGKHGGAERYEKLLASAERTGKLTERVRDFNPEVAVTFSSPEGCRVAFGLGIRQIGLNDSPHSEAVARLTIPLMNKLLCPKAIPYEAWKDFGMKEENVITYNALDPAAWLKNQHQVESRKDKKLVLIRLEESKASYLADKGLTSMKLVDAAVDGFSEIAEVQVLCRYSDQIDDAKKRYEGKAHVVEKVFDGTSLIGQSSLFIGAGGTMNAEAALLGIPTISIAPMNFYVEDYLVDNGLMTKEHEPEALVKTGKNMLLDDDARQKRREKASSLLASMEDPTDKIIAAIMNR